VFGGARPVPANSGVCLRLDQVGPLLPRSPGGGSLLS
jgi:hypothetical protein